MKEISKDEFYNSISDLDATVNVASGKWPYTMEFRLRSRDLIGKLVWSFTDDELNKYPIISTYFINEKYIK